MDNYFKDNRKEQKFQVVKQSPTFGDVVDNIPLKYWATSFAFTTGGFAIGWLSGKHWRVPSGLAAAYIVATGTFAFMFQDSMGKLRGYKENDQELKKHGMEKKQIVEILRKRKIIDRPQELLEK